MENHAKALLAATGLWRSVAFFIWRGGLSRSARRSLESRTLLTVAFLWGIAGFYLMGRTLAAPFPEVRDGIRGLRAAAYAVLLAGTTLIFHRQVTPELLIIVAWAVPELCAVNFLYRCGVLTYAGGNRTGGGD